MSILGSILLYLPLFFVISIISSVPGRGDIKAIFRVGLRHFVVGAVLMLLGCAALYLLMTWLISREPLW